MSAFYIEGKVCNTSKCAIQVNKVGLKPTYPNTRQHIENNNNNKK